MRGAKRSNQGSDSSRPDVQGYVGTMDSGE